MIYKSHVGDAYPLPRPSNAVLLGTIYIQNMRSTDMVNWYSDDPVGDTAAYEAEILRVRAYNKTTTPHLWL